MQPSSRMPPSVIHPKKAGDWRFGFIVVCVVPRVAGCSAWHVAWGSREHAKQGRLQTTLPQALRAGALVSLRRGAPWPPEKAALRRFLEAKDPWICGNLFATHRL